MSNYEVLYSLQHDNELYIALYYKSAIFRKKSADFGRNSG